MLLLIHLEAVLTGPIYHSALLCGQTGMLINLGSTVHTFPFRLSLYYSKRPLKKSSYTVSFMFSLEKA